MKLRCAVGRDPVRNEILLAIWLLLSQHWLRAKAATALAHLSHCNSVSLSVCPSVTWIDQSKTVQAWTTKFLPSAAWKTLVSGTEWWC